jgi:hypothetical protein
VENYGALGSGGQQFHLHHRPASAAFQAGNYTESASLLNQRRQAMQILSPVSMDGCSILPPSNISFLCDPVHHLPVDHHRHHLLTHPNPLPHSGITFNLKTPEHKLQTRASWNGGHNPYSDHSRIVILFYIYFW